MIPTSLSPATWPQPTAPALPPSAPSPGPRCGPAPAPPEPGRIPGMPQPSRTPRILRGGGGGGDRLEGDSRTPAGKATTCERWGHTWPPTHHRPPSSPSRELRVRALPGPPSPRRALGPGERNLPHTDPNSGFPLGDSPDTHTHTDSRNPRSSSRSSPFHAHPRPPPLGTGGGAAAGGGGARTCPRRPRPDKAPRAERAPRRSHPAPANTHPFPGLRRDAGQAGSHGTARGR